VLQSVENQELHLSTQDYPGNKLTNIWEGRQIFHTINLPMKSRVWQNFQDPFLGKYPVYLNSEAAYRYCFGFHESLLMIQVEIL